MDNHPVSTLPIPESGEVRELLIEQWLPIRALGIESGRRESNPRPPLNGFHVWWARRPLAACQGAQLAALLPPFDRLPDGEFASEHEYRKWIVQLVGILGDPVATAAKIDAANAAGERLPSDPYGYRPAFNNSPSVTDLNRLHRLLIAEWGRLPVVLDPTAGGGAIPFSAMRYGLPTLANDLNPVAVGILDATLRTASQFGPDFVTDVEKWAAKLKRRVADRLEPFYVRDDPQENITAYLWVNTVACPRTGGPVPLAPNWWLGKENGGVATRPVPEWNDDGTPSHIHFALVEKPKQNGFDPDKDSTQYRGTVASPWIDGLVIDDSYIRGEAQAGRMWGELYAIATWKPKVSGRGKDRIFREPTKTDLEAVRAAENALDRYRAAWDDADIFPDEEVPPMNPKWDVRRWGMNHFADMFSPRQLLFQGIFIDEWRRLLPELREVYGATKAEDIATVLAMVQNKTTNWNSRFASWNVKAKGLRSTFDRHDYAFKWTYGEFEAAHALLEWGYNSLLDKFGKVVALAQPLSDGVLSNDDLAHSTPGPIELLAGSASALGSLRDGSIECVNMDPPYYDNVMYAELADFFYVWEKRTLGLIEPARFASELTDKDNEAVANPTRFSFAKGRQRSALAEADYESKMRDIFSEALRVLRDDGVLVIWFTHKKSEAWDTLGAALMDAGFTIETSWPINTESAVSLHQANVNAAKSTIVLVCRKRLSVSGGTTTFFERIGIEAFDEDDERLGHRPHGGPPPVDVRVGSWSARRSYPRWTDQ